MGQFIPLPLTTKLQHLINLAFFIFAAYGFTWRNFRFHLSHINSHNCSLSMTRD
jgi:hypothetical protein